MIKASQTICFYFALAGMSFLLNTILCYGQAPACFNYQTMVRNEEGKPLSDTEADIELFIIQGSISGPAVYSEMHHVVSGESGRVTFGIGSEDPAGFSLIDWAHGPFFINILLNGIDMGTSQLLSVPYAEYANSIISLQGPKGDTGPEGPQGDKGDTGPQGPQGDKGGIGPQGPKGEMGDTGLQGPKGDTGPQGPKGDTGAQGPQGIKGDTGTQGQKGDKGDAGAQGSKGDTGDTGSQGTKGDTGDTGPQGSKGDKGDTGPQGLKGFTGAAGPPGTDKVIAFGRITSGSTILSGSGNFTCVWEESLSRIKITITGVDYSYLNYTTIISPVTYVYTYFSHDSLGGSLLIYYDFWLPYIYPVDFNFIVFKQ